MSPRSRFLVIVLLVLSLPVQAFAAISMKYAALPGQPSESALHRTAGMAPAHCHDTLVSAASGGHAEHSAHFGGPHVDHAHACTVCACSGAALPAGPIASVASAVAGTIVVPPPSAGEVSFLTGGIERPPRPFLV